MYKKRTSFRFKAAPGQTASTEEREQIALIKWCKLVRLRHPPYAGQPLLFYHIPNGGHRNIFEGAKLKRMGVSAGIPDLCIPMPFNGYHGLYIELKRREGGQVSEAQKCWLANLSALGYAVHVANGWDAARIAIMEYFDLC